MRATAEGYAGPLQKATFYKGLGNNLISAAKLYADSNVSIIMIKTGMLLCITMRQPSSSTTLQLSRPAEQRQMGCTKYNSDASNRCCTE